MYLESYDFRIVEAFRIFIGKGIVNDYWRVCVFVIGSVFGMSYGCRIANAFRS